MTKTDGSNIGREFPVVVGEVVTLPEGVDETYGLPAEAAREVKLQVLQALTSASISPEGVVFSGYDDSDNEGHGQKAAGDFGNVDSDADDSTAHEYFFGTVADLDDGEEGPLAYAASGDAPVLGVYDIATLGNFGYEYGRVVATPAQVLAAMVLEFRPQYRHPEYSDEDL